MGLDIVNTDSESIQEDIQYTLSEYIKDKNLIEKLMGFVSDGEDDKFTEHLKDKSIIEAPEEEVDSQHEQLVSSATYHLNKLRSADKNDITDADREIAKKYEWILQDEEVGNGSRMGSYSTIHYGRMFAYKMDCYYNSIGEDISNTQRKVTRDEVKKILEEMSAEERTGYGSDTFFTNFCNHSDCDGYYYPIKEQVRDDDGNIDYEAGSSIGLLKELDALYNTGAMDELNSLMEDIKKEYTEIERRNAPEEICEMYGLAETVKWVIMKMLYHAVSSVLEESTIQFC